MVAAWRVAQALGLRGPAQRHEAADIGGDGGDVGEDVAEEFGAALGGLVQLIGLHEGHAALVHDQPVRAQEPRDVLVELVGEEHLADADRVRAVHDDDVEELASALRT
jgi:hypothetical protein